MQANRFRVQKLDLYRKLLTKFYKCSTFMLPEEVDYIRVCFLMALSWSRSVYQKMVRMFWHHYTITKVKITCLFHQIVSRIFWELGNVPFLGPSCRQASLKCCDSSQIVCLREGWLNCVAVFIRAFSFVVSLYCFFAIRR